MGTPVLEEPNRNRARAHAFRVIRALRIAARDISDLDVRHAFLGELRRLHAELNYQQTAEHFNDIAGRAGTLGDRFGLHVQVEVDASS